MMRTRHHIALLATIGLTLGGCSGLKVNSDYDPDVNFSKYGSYAWIPEPPAGEKNPDGEPGDGLLRQRIERAVDGVLATKGMRRVDYGTDGSNASLLVSEHVSVEKKLRVNTTNYGYGYGRWGYYGGGYPNTTVDQYDEGTLMIDFIDAESKQLVWRGMAQSRLRDLKTPAERDERVREVVDAILTRYPPKKQKQ